MNYGKLIKKNITCYQRYYKLIAVAVIITVAVITGSLLVGDSVRNTLIKRVYERLGNTETIVFSMNSFMDASILSHPSMKNTRGVLLTNGFISKSGQFIPVMVWGTDDQNIPRGKAKINSSLAKELAYGTDDIVLRLPATGLVPSGSLFVTENYTTSVRLEYTGIVSTGDGGNISLKNEQILPLNLFMNREELAETLEIENRINLVLSEDLLLSENFEKIWNYSISGLSIYPGENYTEIISDRVFIQEPVIELLRQSNPGTNRLFSYLVNSIENEQVSIPYSFVTAMDNYKGIKLDIDEIILSDYAAKRIKATVSDTLRLTYFTSSDLKTLFTDTLELRVKKIVPLAELVADSTLSAEFPGLSDVERCTDWDSDLPIHMDLITPADETYWEEYRNTPKAIIPYQAVAAQWGNPYGNATALRVPSNQPVMNGLESSMFGIQLIHPRESGLLAAMNGVDFAGLFLALGFFIIISALLLMLVPLTEMLYQRRHEIALLSEVGYSGRKILRILWLESAPVVFISSLIGIGVGILYTLLIMWLLGNIWQGATHTDGFTFSPDRNTMWMGLLAGLLLSMLSLRITLINSLWMKKPPVTLRRIRLRKNLLGLFLTTILSVSAIVVNFLFLHSVTLFILIGILLIGTFALWGNYIINWKGASRFGKMNSSKLVWATLYAHKKQAILSFFTLSIGVFIVFSVGLNRKGFADSNQLISGTGRYTLWCETSIPVYHNLSTEDGRKKLGLTALPQDIEVLQCFRYQADEASCLNLNKALFPSVLGINMEVLTESDFNIKKNTYHMDRTAFFERIQSADNHVYPALIDETVLLWSLGKKLGDTIRYEGSNGKIVNILLAGILDNTIFQGYILIDRNHFRNIWEEITGSEIFLIEAPLSETEEIKNLLATGLHEYGVRITTTAERLKEFNSVTDTYLTIFMTLGGIGLLLGIISFIVVVRKNLVTRRKEIELYRVLGFADSMIENVLYKENILIPLYAIFTGIFSSLLGASISLRHLSVWVWGLAIVWALLFVSSVIIFVRKSVEREVRRQ